jgi:hypothetical protein
LHHVELRLFFCLMHIFELFEFVACLTLNPKEKTKGKGIKNSGIKRKGKEARNPSLQVFRSTRPSGPRAPACPLPLTGGPALSALSLACLHARAFSAGCPTRQRLCPLPTCAIALRAPPASSSPSFNHPPERTVRTPAETAVPTSPLRAKPSPQPPMEPLHAPTYFPPASFILPQRTHLSCSRPFSKLAGASLSPGLLHPNPSPTRLPVVPACDPPPVDKVPPPPALHPR